MVRLEGGARGQGTGRGRVDVEHEGMRQGGVAVLGLGRRRRGLEQGRVDAVLDQQAPGAGRLPGDAGGAPQSVPEQAAPGGAGIVRQADGVLRLQVEAKTGQRGERAGRVRSRRRRGRDRSVDSSGEPVWAAVGMASVPRCRSIGALLGDLLTRGSHHKVDGLAARIAVASGWASVGCLPARRRLRSWHLWPC